MNIVLFEPEIPQNTGNIARTCTATGSTLHLVKPLGFSIDEKSVRRAGLDYWDNLNLVIYESIDDFFEKNKNANMYFVSTKSKKTYDLFKYNNDDFFIFGKETKGIPEKILFEHYEKCIRIPMKGDSRSLNLSNAVAIVLYEGLRQIGFDSLQKEGNLTKY